ncbi:hypothetical protein BDV25DRAFT_167796 [Aspergillus avenaceus]|uniref:Uncharacterized protein n=1 Tax=Aspergillus avenaceus TaxID=36643 RepID=A0A5N6U671_ASPAV|nr:hypothetical protein BDV25DRAFT_167796 [Aspergillus avenaceus]
MKRSRSCSPRLLPSKQHRLHVPTACLTHEALEEHNHNTLPLPPGALLGMVSSEREHGFSDIPVIPLPPSSTRSSQRSRSSSPTRPNDAQYRAGHLRRAKIFVGAEIPICIGHYTDTKVFQGLTNYNNDSIRQASQKLFNMSKELEGNPSGEVEWTEALYTAINALKPAGLKAVRNRDWRSDINPPVQNPRPIIPQKRNQFHQLLQDSAATDSIYPSPGPSRVTQQAIPTFRLEDPQPDICIGLSDIHLADALEHTKGRDLAQSLLLDMQDTSTLISDPHITPLGIPQNQAAVGGSSALLILQSLLDLRDNQDRNEETQNTIEAGHTSDPAPPEIVLNVAFSITTEGPVHELWLHFWKSKEDGFHMACIGIWRTTSEEGSLSLLQHISAILRWADGDYKDSLISILKIL